MRSIALGVTLTAICAALQAQTFDSFKAQCIADQRAACAAGKWWRATPDPYAAPGASVDEVGYTKNQIGQVNNYANYACGAPLQKEYQLDSYMSWAATNSATALALVSAAARIEGDCSAQARQMMLLQQILDVAKDNQQTLKGDIQAILSKLMPGATVTITLPPPKPAAVPK